MSRRYSNRSTEASAKAKRTRALARTELRTPSEPRQAAHGVTSLAVKVVDGETRRLIDEALDRRPTFTAAPFDRPFGCPLD